MCNRCVRVLWLVQRKTEGKCGMKKAQPSFFVSPFFALHCRVRVVVGCVCFEMGSTQDCEVFSLVVISSTLKRTGLTLSYYLPTCSHTC